MNPIEGLDDQPAAQAAPAPTPDPDNGDRTLDARAALLPLTEAALRRLVNRETRTAEKLRGRAEGLAALYAELADLWGDALAPIAEAFTAWSGKPARPETTAWYIRAELGAAEKAASATPLADAEKWAAARLADVPAAALRYLGAIGVDHA